MKIGDCLRKRTGSRHWGRAVVYMPDAQKKLFLDLVAFFFVPAKIEEAKENLTYFYAFLVNELGKITSGTCFPKQGR